MASTSGRRSSSPSRPATPGKGKGGAKRHKKIYRDYLRKVTKPALRRLARRAAVKRLSGGVYEDVRGLVRTFIESVVYYALMYKTSHGRKTIALKDVVFALKRRGTEFVGGEGFAKKQKKKGGKGKKK